MVERTADTGSSPARTLARGMAVLEAVGAAPDGVGVTEVAARCHLDKGTTSRLLASLRRLGYVRQRSSDKRYLLTSRVLRLAVGFSAQFDLREVARPFLTALRDRTTETVHLAVREGLHLVYVDQLQPDQAVQVAMSIGNVLPLHVTAMGRAVLAALGPAEREEQLERLLPDKRYADFVVDLDQIRNELRDAERRGWATADRHDDVARVGAAVLDAAGRPVGAISISGPSYRVAPKLAELGADCRETARAISAELGA